VTGRRGTVGGVPHPLLNPLIVEALERAATRHLGRAWKPAGFTGLDHRATHPCGIFTGTPFSVFAKLDTSPSGEGQFTAELRGFSLIRSRTAVATPVPVAGGVIVTRRGTLLLSEALPERGAASGQAADSRAPGDYAAIGRALAGLHQARGETFGLAEFDGFYGPLPQCNRPAGPGRWTDFYAERRVLPMLLLAVDSGYLPAGLARGVERVVAQLPALCGPDPVPALLHGDAQQNNFVSTADGAAVVDVAPYFGHPEADLALVDIYSPVDPELFHAYAESAPLDPGFAGRRELWRLHGYLAAIAVAGANAFGRSFFPRLDAAIRQYT
jgi:fructosamine-3-kinase